MDEDLSEFREKASVSASCTCRERRQRRVPPGAGMGQSGPPERCRAVVREDQRSEHRQHVHLVQEPSLGRGWEMTRGCHSQQSATPGLGWRAGELPSAVNQSWSACPQAKCHSRLAGSNSPVALCRLPARAEVFASPEDPGEFEATSG